MAPDTRVIIRAREARARSDLSRRCAIRTAATGLISNVYYWESLEALQKLMQHPSHLVAKGRQATWLNGYQIVISQVLKTYGDGGIAHPLSGHISQR